MVVSEQPEPEPTPDVPELQRDLLAIPKGAESPPMRWHRADQLPGGVLRVTAHDLNTKTAGQLLPEAPPYLED